MINISIKKGTKSYRSRIVLNNVNFSITEGQKLAVVGSNGEGKSTLLKIISGLEQLDSGELHGSENYCAYIGQDFSGDPEETPREFMDRNFVPQDRALKMLEGAGMDLGSNRERFNALQCKQLSGGERKKLEIVAGLAINPAFVAIDEPENHLDINTIDWLVNYLRRYRGGLIFVSHDQYFVDQLADTVIELESGSLTSYSMSYEEYLNEKGKQVDSKHRSYLAGKQVIERLKRTVEMMRTRAAKTSTTAATYHHTRKRLEKLQEQNNANRIKAVERPKIVMADPAARHHKSQIEISNLSFQYDDIAVFKNVSANLSYGDKVALLGPNGSGKSTLVKLLTGQLTPTEGRAEIRSGVKWLVMTQDHLEGINPEETTLDVFRKEATLPESEWRTLLVNYGITRDLVNVPLRQLSGGQQARMKLALIISQRPELIIMDEPTNHVDPITWDAIVEAINQFPGTILAVTHDRAFVDAIATSLWIINDKQIHIEYGSYDEYLEKARVQL